MQTRWQYNYGVRRTLANKMERQARAIRVGDWEKYRRLEAETTMWAERKISEMTGA